MKNQSITLKLIIFLIIFLSQTIPGHAATYRSSNGSGDWSTSSNWTSSGSGSIVVVVINSGHTITLDVNATSVDTIIINGTFNFGNGKTLILTPTGHIFVGLGSTGTITGGNANSGFLWASGSTFILGPFTGTNEISGDSLYANQASAIAGGGVPAASFIHFTPLPLVLLDFDLSSNNTYHMLSWKAEGTPENDVFVVSVSDDGITFTDYQSFVATGEGGIIEYHCNIPKTSRSVYIRLSLIESGRTEILRTVFASAARTPLSDVKIYPSVIGGNNESFQLLLPEAGPYSVQIYDVSLKAVMTISLTAQSPNEIVVLDAKNIGLVNGGIYYVLVTNESGIAAKTPIVVQN